MNDDSHDAYCTACQRVQWWFKSWHRLATLLCCSQRQLAQQECFPRHSALCTVDPAVSRQQSISLTHESHANEGEVNTSDRLPSSRRIAREPPVCGIVIFLHAAFLTRYARQSDPLPASISPHPSRWDLRPTHEHSRKCAPSFGYLVVLETWDIHSLRCATLCALAGLDSRPLRRHDLDEVRHHHIPPSRLSQSDLEPLRIVDG